MLKELIVSHGKKEGPGELRRITKVVRPLITTTASRIFLAFEGELLARPMEYIVPAIWGAAKDEDLDDTQRAVRLLAQRTVSTAADALQIECLDRAQQFCIEFFVRELLISKIIIWKTTRQSEICLGNGLRLDEVEVAGHA